MSLRSVRMPSSIRVEFSPIRELFKVPVIRCQTLLVSTIDLWPLTLTGQDTEYGRCLDWLDQQERERAARFLRQQDRERYVLAHGGLRFILGLYLGLDPARIEFGSTATGKPTLAGLRPENAALTFNLSHAHGNAMVAVAQGRDVGVDLEMIRRTWRRSSWPSDSSLSASTCSCNPLHPNHAIGSSFTTGLRKKRS